MAVVARDGARAEAAAAELPGEGHRGYVCDVADSASVAALVKQVEADLGSPDILVNNAGVTRDNLLMRLKDEDWDEVLDTNLRGAFNTIRAAVARNDEEARRPDHQHHERGGDDREQGAGELRRLQGGLIGLTKSVAKELASRGILVNAVAPGYIETDMTAELARGGARGAAWGRSRSGGSGSRRTSRRWCAFSRGRARRTSPARCWWWTAEWSSRQQGPRARACA